MLEIIEKEASDINIRRVAEEILTWVEKNVESFIDNQNKTFKIDMLIESEEMSEAMKMQSLYRKVTGGNLSDDEYKVCMEVLNNTTSQIHNEMRKREDLLETLFKRMVFYYEMVGVSNGRALVKELTGAVDIINFEYEAFSVGVKVKGKGYEIPESFTIWVEISFKENRPTSIF